MSGPRCGARNKAGRPCRRHVPAEGARCYAHDPDGGHQAIYRPLCEVADCGRPRYVHGRCRGHAARLARGAADPDGPIAPYGRVRGLPCALEHCSRPASVRVGERPVCARHWRRHRDGMPDWDGPLATTYRAHAPRAPRGQRRRQIHVLLSPGALADLQHLADVRMLTMSRLAAELLESLISRARAGASDGRAAAEVLDVHAWIQRPDAWGAV